MPLDCLMGSHITIATPALDGRSRGEGQIYLTCEGKVSISGLAPCNTKVWLQPKKSTVSNQIQPLVLYQFHATKLVNNLYYLWYYSVVFHTVKLKQTPFKDSNIHIVLRHPTPRPSKKKKRSGETQYKKKFRLECN